LEERLTGLGDLKRKYGRTLDDVIAFGEQTTRRARELEELIADADEIDSIVSKSRAEVAERAGALSEAREANAAVVTGEVASHLADLGLASARVEIDLEMTAPGPTGADHPVLRFASDSRLDPGPVGSVASGGELSRLVLALRLATRSEATTTLVFDEVDTGIGGSTALAMGKKLRALSRDGQVLCVTHLAQVASHADTHYVVERAESGVASVRRVTGDGRVTEVSRMLAGQPDSEAGQTAAAELLATASG
jgi:DNA repair protein RecN (Recombination protein N)